MMEVSSRAPFKLRGPRSMTISLLPIICSDVWPPIPYPRRVGACLRSIQHAARLVGGAVLRAPDPADITYFRRSQSRAVLLKIWRTHAGPAVSGLVNRTRLGTRPRCSCRRCPSVWPITPASPPAPAQVKARDTSFAFEPNVGQTDPQVKFLARRGQEITRCF
jgi:hypothetical protein